MGISLHPEEFSSGGFFEPGVYKFTDTRFTVFDYNGQAKPGIALHSTLISIETGQPNERYWSVGPLERWSHSDDGQELFPVGNAKAVSENCRFAALQTSLLKAGYPSDRLRTDKVSDIYDGLVAYLDNVKAPRQEGMAPRQPRINPQTGEPFPDRDDTQVVILEVKVFPWEDGTATGTAPAASAAPVRAAAAAAPATAQRGRATAAATATATRPVTANRAAAAPTNGSAQAQAPASFATGPSSELAESAKQESLSATYELLANAGEGGLVSRSDLMTAVVSRLRGKPEQPVAMGMLSSTQTWQQWELEGLVSLHDGGTRVGLPQG